MGQDTCHNEGNVNKPQLVRKAPHALITPHLIVILFMKMDTLLPAMDGQMMLEIFLEFCRGG